MPKKTRVEVPINTAAGILFESDRRCCVCRKDHRQVQIHHIDDDPSNCLADNLAVLCFDCHLETQIRGGFARKLDAAQIVLYKTDWIKRVAAQRDNEHGAHVSSWTDSKGTRVLRFLQLKEDSRQHLYSFDAEYPQIGYEGSIPENNTNLSITAFITKALQRFRADAIASSGEKNKLRRELNAPTAWDDLSISHSVVLYTSELLSLEFSVTSYHSMAFHPNRNTYTLNFRLRPSTQLDLPDIFKPSSDYLRVLSEYCVADLHKQQVSRWHDPQQRAEELKKKRDEWILFGAGPTYENYRRLALAKNGVRIFFDAYQVGSYAEGRYDVFVPLKVISPIISESVAKLIT